MSIENPFKSPDDKLLFAKVIDKYISTQKKQVPTHTDFIDPVRCAAFIQTLERLRLDASIVSYGGYENAERKIITFFPEQGKESPPLFIVPIAITYNEKFSKAPTHRDYLGAVLGLGLDRGKIGDIRLADTGAVLYVLEEVSHFIAENLNQVGRVTVKTKAHQELDKLENTGRIKRITVPSMRLDAVLSSALNLSRGKAATLIESEKVFVNWKQAKKTHTIAVGDAITVRGMGRFSIDSLGGNTKKDRIVLEITTN